MKRQSISLCAFPTTVMVVDDEPGMHIGLRNALRNQKIILQSFEEPRQALDYIEQDYDFLPLSEQLLKSQEGGLDQVATCVNLREVESIYRNPERFKRITVLIVDFAMPDINGLEFCEKLKRDDFRIILLTGEAGYDLAVTAFNKGLIHQFILKSTPNLFETLTVAIHEQQKLYFAQQSALILRNTQQMQQLNVQLSDPVVIDLFEDICQKNTIVEHYILETEGGFLLADAEGNVSFLITKNEEALNDYLQLADMTGEAPPAVVDALKKHTHVPLFYLESDLHTPPEDWMPYLHPATLLKGEACNYFYAFLPKAEGFGVEKDNILSYKKYFNKMNE